MQTNTVRHTAVQCVLSSKLLRLSSTAANDLFIAWPHPTRWKAYHNSEGSRAPLKCAFEMDTLDFVEQRGVPERGVMIRSIDVGQNIHDEIIFEHPSTSPDVEKNM